MGERLREAMTKLTQAQFKGKCYTLEIVSNEDYSISINIYPLHPSSNEYVVVQHGQVSAIFPATTQGFKDAIKVFNEES